MISVLSSTPAAVLNRPSTMPAPCLLQPILPQANPDHLRVSSAAVPSPPDHRPVDSVPPPSHAAVLESGDINELAGSKAAHLHPSGRQTELEINTPDPLSQPDPQSSSPSPPPGSSTMRSAAPPPACMAATTPRSGLCASRHMAAEQRRRARINERLDALREIVPHSARSNTAAFLTEVYDYIASLHKQLERRPPAKSPSDHVHSTAAALATSASPFACRASGLPQPAGSLASNVGRLATPAAVAGPTVMQSALPSFTAATVPPPSVQLPLPGSVAAIGSSQTQEQGVSAMKREETKVEAIEETAAAAGQSTPAVTLDLSLTVGGSCSSKAGACDGSSPALASIPDGVAAVPSHAGDSRVLPWVVTSGVCHAPAGGMAPMQSCQDRQVFTSSPPLGLGSNGAFSAYVGARVSKRVSEPPREKQDQGEEKAAGKHHAKRMKSSRASGGGSSSSSSTCSSQSRDTEKGKNHDPAEDVDDKHDSAVKTEAATEPGRPEVKPGACAGGSTNVSFGTDGPSQPPFLSGSCTSGVGGMPLHGVASTWPGCPLASGPGLPTVPEAVGAAYSGLLRDKLHGPSPPTSPPALPPALPPLSTLAGSTALQPQTPARHGEGKTVASCASHDSCGSRGLPAALQHMQQLQHMAMRNDGHSVHPQFLQQQLQNDVQWHGDASQQHELHAPQHAATRQGLSQPFSGSFSTMHPPPAPSVGSPMPLPGAGGPGGHLGPYTMHMHGMPHHPLLGPMHPAAMAAAAAAAADAAAAAAAAQQWNIAAAMAQVQAQAAAQAHVQAQAMVSAAVASSAAAAAAATAPPSVSPLPVAGHAGGSFASLPPPRPLTPSLQSSEITLRSALGLPGPSGCAVPAPATSTAHASAAASASCTSSRRGRRRATGATPSAACESVAGRNAEANCGRTGGATSSAQQQLVRPIAVRPRP